MTIVIQMFLQLILIQFNIGSPNSLSSRGGMYTRKSFFKPASRIAIARNRPLSKSIYMIEISMKSGRFH
jgi:hypothetical protein